MKIVYAGADARMSVAPLQALLAAGFDIAAVVTQPDRPVGRKRLLTPNAVKVCAQGAGLPVYCFERIRDHAAELAALGCGAMVTCAYGQILTQEVLDAFPRGVYNIHASLLPPLAGRFPRAARGAGGRRIYGRHRHAHRTGAGQRRHAAFPPHPRGGKDGGRAPCRALRPGRGGDRRSAQKSGKAAPPCSLRRGKRASPSAKRSRRKTAASIFQNLPKKSAAWCAPCAPNLSPSPRCAGGSSTYWRRSPPLPRRGTGQPGAVLRADKRGILVQAGEGCVRILSLQFEGGKPLRAADAVNGRKISPGDVLGG